MQPHRIVVVTPAGRRHYLEILKTYILADTDIAEWHLWDNCRNPKDRDYIHELEAINPKIKVISLPDTDGTNRSVNRFYPFSASADTFYIKMDDDLVYLQPGLAKGLYQKAIAERDRYIWWSPLVVNNAVCTWLLKYHSQVRIRETPSCQASDKTGWASPQFAEKLHLIFLDALESGKISDFRVGDFEVSLSRFSINCIGYFGEDVASLGATFCPLDADDEEWISAVLPSKCGKLGRVVGSLVVSHFSFFTQEKDLLQNRILDQYYKVIGRSPEPYQYVPPSFRKRIFASYTRGKSKLKDWLVK